MDENGERDLQPSASEVNKKPRYPWQVFFIVGNEFCERFSYYGMRGILILYLTSKLRFDANVATVIYHTFTMFCYFTPVLGAILSDSLLGKFRTIVYVSLIYILGHLCKTIACVTPLNLPQKELSLVGLGLIALGTGGIKPCVAAFGGDQFQLPAQQLQLMTFFSVFYFSINLGSMLSNIVTPILKADVQCFDSDDHTCYALAFGVPALLMLIATIILVIGKRFYIIKPAEGNMLFLVCGCIGNAIWKKLTGKSGDQEHWLDVSKNKYSSELVDDIKILLRIFVLYLPLPFFWALFDQQGSRWTLQASRMVGALSDNVDIIPDQMQLVNSALVIILIPIFQVIVYPLLARCNLLVNPLHRMTVGGLFAAVSFLVSGFVELQLEKNYPRLPQAGLSNVHLMNSLPCNVAVQLNSANFSTNFTVAADLNYILYDLQPGKYDLNIEPKPSCSGKKSIYFDLEEDKVKALFVLPTQGDFEIYDGQLAEDPEKDESSGSKMRALINVGSSENMTVVFAKSQEICTRWEVQMSVIEGLVSETPYTAGLRRGTYDILLSLNGTEKAVGTIEAFSGLVSTVVISKGNKDKDQYKLNSFTLTPKNELHMLWQLPQYIIITIGEIMFSITGLEFSYSKAPSSMKSVVQAVWLLTVAFGNLIDIVVAKVHLLNQTNEFFMFGGTMVIDMALFAILAYLFQKTEADEKAARESED